MAAVNWGTIGCGDVCEKKAGPALYGVDDSRLVAVMRRTREKAEDFARRHSVPRFYDDVDALLADDEVDAVYVATPNHTHLEPVLAAAAAGKHVLVEKPMARNTAACQQMIDACREADVVLAVAYYRRCYPTILRAKALVDEGAIGTLREIRINDEFPLSHRLDLMHFFAGDARTVWTRTEDLPPCSHAERGPMLYVRHASGAVCVTPVGWDENLVPETLDLRGSLGRILILDLKGGLLVVHRGQEKTREDLGPLPATHWGLVENFVAHVKDGTALACDGVEGRKSTVILDIVGDLAPDGPEIDVDYT